MNCEEARELLLPYLHGELGRSERELIRAHLAECAACQRELEVLTELQSRLTEALQSKSSHVSPPPNSWSRLQAHIAAQGQPELSLRQRAALARAWVRLRMRFAFVAAFLANARTKPASRASVSHSMRGAKTARNASALALVGVMAMSFLLAATLIVRNDQIPLSPQVDESSRILRVLPSAQANAPATPKESEPKAPGMASASATSASAASVGDQPAQSAQPAPVQPATSSIRPVLSNSSHVIRQAPFAPVDLEWLREEMALESAPVDWTEEFGGPRPCLYCPRLQ
jgi:hypothetical protein